MGEIEQDNTKPLRCVHFLPSIRVEQGGVVRAVVDICTVLAARGNDVTLITWDAADCPEAWTAGRPGFPRVVVINPPRSLFWRQSPHDLAKVAEVLKQADVLHLHGVWSISNI